jgi:HK97 family phage major capsid protein
MKQPVRKKKEKREQIHDTAIEIIEKAKSEMRDLTEDEEKELDELRSQMEDEDEPKDETPTSETDEEKDETVEDTEDKEKETDSTDDSDDEKDEEPVDEEKENKDYKRSNITTMKKEFRLVKAIRDIANNQQMDDVTMAVINAGQEENRKSGVNAQGQIQLPTEERATVTVTAEGEDVVATELFDILTPLRAKNVLVNAGARFMGNLVGNVQVPIMSPSNVTWEGETATASDGAPTFSHKTLSPKRLTAYIDISKQMIAQDSIGVENAIRQDLVNAINSKLEATILGSAEGSTTQPEGIFHAVTATTVSDFADVCDKEADVDDANVLGDCTYVMSNKAKSAMRSMIKGTNATGMVYENGEVDGTKAYNTSNVSGTNYVYGDFSNLAIGSWGGVDLTVDPFTKAADGQIRLVVNMYVDAVVLRPEAFAAGTIGE